MKQIKKYGIWHLFALLSVSWPALHLKGDDLIKQHHLETFENITFNVNLALFLFSMLFWCHDTEIVLFKKSIPWLVYITWPWRWEGSGSRARKSRREHLIEIEVGGDPSWGCWRWNLLTLADEVLERHGAAVEEQAGTECRIDTGGEGGGGGEEGGRGRRWGNVVDTNVLLEAWGSDRTGFSRQEINVSEISVWGELF